MQSPCASNASVLDMGWFSVMLGTDSSLACLAGCPPGSDFGSGQLYGLRGDSGVTRPRGTRRGPPLAGAGDCHLAGRGLRHAPGGSGSPTPGTRAPAPAPRRVDCGRRPAPTTARVCTGWTPAAPEPTRALGAGPTSHSTIALSTTQPPRSSAPCGSPPQIRPPPLIPAQEIPLSTLRSPGRARSGRSGSGPLSWTGCQRLRPVQCVAEGIWGAVIYQ